LGIFAVVMGAWMLVYRYPPKALTGTQALHATTAARTAPGETAVTAPISGEEGGDDEVSREGRYKAQLLYGVKRDYHLLSDPPVLGGRWVCEGLVMPAVAVFDTKDKWIGAGGKAIGVLAMLVSVLGLIVMLRAGHWWLLGAGVYFMAIWLQWGIRSKPR